MEKTKKKIFGNKFFYYHRDYFLNFGIFMFIVKIDQNIIDKKNINKNNKSENFLFTEQEKRKNE